MYIKNTHTKNNNIYNYSKQTFIARVCEVITLNENIYICKYIK